MSTYDFRALSPIDFEQFARDLLNAELGLSFETFAVGRDGGIDMRATKDGEAVVAQCKHTPNATRRDLTRAAEREVAKFETAPAQYHFVTSAAISPDTQAELARTLKPLGATLESVWHAGTLNTILNRQPGVHRQHFKLWLASGDALDLIINAKQWQRSELLLQRIVDRVRLYVATPTFQLAWDQLQQENVTVISGAPGVGKSTLAEMILLQYWREGWRIVDLTDEPSEGFRYMSDPDQILFFCDDFLGQTNAAEVTGGSASGLSLLLDRVRRGDGRKRVVMTTREQVLSEAQYGRDDRLRRLAGDPGKTRLELTDLDRSTRARILFNHLHFAVTDPSRRRVLAKDRRCLAVVDHPNFNPRLIETATLRQSFKTADEFYHSIRRALDAPSEVWAGSFDQLSTTASRVLLSLAVHPHGTASERSLRQAHPVDLEARAWVSALRVLDGVWVRIQAGVDDESTMISLYDPSRRDFLHELLREPEYLASTIANSVELGQLGYIGRFLVNTANYSPASARALIAPLGEMLRRTLDRSRETYLKQRARAESDRDARFAAGRPWRGPDANHKGFLESMSAAMSAIDVVRASGEPIEVLIRRVVHGVESIATADPLSMDVAEASFELAAQLIGHGVEPKSVNDLLRLGAWSINGQADFEAFERVTSSTWREWVNWEGLRDALKEALDREVDDVRQQDDPDLVESWLNEIESRADDYGVTVYLDSEYEHLEDLRAAPRRAVVKPELRVAAPTAAVASDDEILQLFERLL